MNKGKYDQIVNNETFDDIINAICDDPYYIISKIHKEKNKHLYNLEVLITKHVKQM